MSRFHAAGASLAVAAALAAVAFGAGGGAEFDQTGFVETLVLLAAGIVIALAVLLGRGGRLYGAGAVAGLGAYVAIVALSVSWSITPDVSLAEAGRGLTYLAVFAAAVTATHAWPGVVQITVRGIVIASVALCGWALLTRMFPGNLAELVVGARLGAPFDYWNALSSVATIGLVPALWLGTRPASTPLARALTFPATGALLLTLVLTQSRGGILAAATALIIWFAVTPFRLRSLAILALAAVVVLPVAMWALTKDAFTKTLVPLSAREDVAGRFGLFVVLALIVLFAFGLAFERSAQGRAISLPGRRRLGVAALVLACMIPLAGLTAVAASDRGLGGTISKSVDDLTSGRKSAPPRGAARLGSTDSARGGYWGEAVDVFADRPLAGDGAGSFEVSRLRYRDDPGVVRKAHSFVFQTLADTGLIGLLAALAAFSAWLFAAARSLGVPRRRAVPGGRDWSDERTAVLALALAAVAFGVQSAIDWIWLIPAPAIMALLAAGVVAGRGPLPALGAARGLDPPRLPRAERTVWAAAILLTAVICAWTVAQPARADRAVQRSTEKLVHGDPAGAVEAANDALAIEPHSLPALLARASAQQEAEHLGAALATLRTAVLEHPRNPLAWRRLGMFEAEQLHSVEPPLRIAEVMNRLDPQSGVSGVLIGLSNQNRAKQ